MKRRERGREGLRERKSEIGKETKTVVEEGREVGRDTEAGRQRYREAER